MKSFIMTAVIFFIVGSVFALFMPKTAWAATSSQDAPNALALGAQAPEFQLTDVVSGKTITLDDYRDKKGLLVIFMCRHCPYVQHVKKELARLGDDCRTQGIGVVAISANDPAAYPEDAPGSLREMAVEEKFSFPLLFDETQAVAKAYTAVATPDSFLFDGSLKLVYRGQLDATRPGGKDPANGKDIRAAIDNMLAGKPVSSDQKPSIGCSIKWKPGNAPKR